MDEDTRVCPVCSGSISPASRLGPHISGHRRTENAKYRYFGNCKHPYEWKACLTCGVASWIQKRRNFCSYRCSKLGDLNPSKQRAAGHGLTKLEYVKAHTAVRKERGKAFGCLHCGTTAKRMYHWANVSGNYWDPQDFISLCVPCHDRFDRYGKKTA